MWIFTRKGFFSVVQKPEQRGTNDITIRARVLADLEALKDLMPESSQIESHTGTDYPYRMTAGKDDLVTALAAEVWDMDYSNFKNTVQDHKRHAAYSKAWGVLISLEDLNHANYC